MSKNSHSQAKRSLSKPIQSVEDMESSLLQKRIRDLALSGSFDEIEQSFGAHQLEESQKFVFETLLHLKQLKSNDNLSDHTPITDFMQFAAKLFDPTVN